MPTGPARGGGRTRQYVFRRLTTPATGTCDICGRRGVPCPAAVVGSAVPGGARRTTRERRVCQFCASSLEQLFFGEGGLVAGVLLWWEQEDDAPP